MFPVKECLVLRRNNSRCRLNVCIRILGILLTVSRSRSCTTAKLICNCVFFPVDIVRIECDVTVYLCIEVINGKVIARLCCPSCPCISLRNSNSMGTAAFLNDIAVRILYGRHIIFIDLAAVIDGELYRGAGAFHLRMNGCCICRSSPLCIDHDIICRHGAVEIKRNRAFLILEPALEGICFREASRTSWNVRRIAIERSLIKEFSFFNYIVIVVVSKFISVSGITNVEISTEIG